jgi:hypothetical protein
MQPLHNESKRKSSLFLFPPPNIRQESSVFKHKNFSEKTVSRKRILRKNVWGLQKRVFRDSIKKIERVVPENEIVLFILKRKAGADGAGCCMVP